MINQQGYLKLLFKVCFWVYSLQCAFVVHASSVQDYFQNCTNGKLANGPPESPREDRIKDWFVCMAYYCREGRQLRGEFTGDNNLRIIHDGIIYATSTWGNKTPVTIPEVQPGDVIQFRLYNTGGPGSFIGRWSWMYSTYNTSPAMFQHSYTVGGHTYSAVNNEDIYIQNVLAGWQSTYIKIRGWYPDAQFVWTGYDPQKPTYSSAYPSYGVLDFYWTAPQARECEWYNRLRVNNGTGIEPEFLGQMFQEIKNFIAIQQLEFSRARVLDQVKPPPQYQQTQFSGYKASMIQWSVQQAIQQRNWQLYVWDMFNSGENDLDSFINKHFQYYCSYFAAGNAGEQQYCSNANTPLPYDILGSSLLQENQIPPKETMYLYRTPPGVLRHYFAVNEKEKDRLLNRYESDLELVAEYPNVDKQMAAVTYIRNLTSAVPAKPLNDEKLYDDKDSFKFSLKHGIPYLHDKLMLVGGLSMARNSLLQMYSDRLPRAEAQPVNNYGIATDSITSSYLALLAYESERRFSDGDWYAQMEKLPLEAMLKELANMYALQSAIKFKTMLHVERIEALAAASNAFSVNTFEKGAEIARQQAAEAGG